MTTTIIPAAAGYYGLWSAPGSSRGYGRAPIVAWHLSQDGDGDVELAEPILDGEVGPRVEAILCPDGTVNEARGGEWWETITDWAGVLK